MNKTAVMTIAIGDNYHKISQISKPLFEQYAKKINADFIFINFPKVSLTSPHWEKFQIFDLLNVYDRIIYLDSDILIREDCPNLFDIVPENQLGMFNESPFTANRELSMIEVCKQYNETLSKWDRKYYNTGVMVVSRRHKYLFKKPEQECFNFYEQSYLNLVIAKENNKVREFPLMFDIPHYFNRMTCMDFLGDERFSSFIIHYAGYPSLSFVLNLMEQDLKKLKKDYPHYSYKKHILIDVQGGLGDQVCSQPAIRYMKQYIYPDEDITIKTHFPRLFKDISGIKIYFHDEFVPEKDIPYYSVCSLPGANTLMWQCVSNLLCHTVDFSSMALLRRILPNMDKQITLQPTLNEVNNLFTIAGRGDLKNFVLVHPGKHWESKTFPKQWWQEVVNELDKRGISICLFGFDEITRGVWDLALPKNSIDLRNRLELGELIALLSIGRVLISNDSAPIHIAGAFNNYIILIPSCKHPDHVLPYRNGNITYKTSALYKKLTLDDCSQAPTEIYGVLGDKIKGDFNTYLPDIQTVINKVVEVI